MKKTMTKMLLVVLCFVLLGGSALAEFETNPFWELTEIGNNSDWTVPELPIEPEKTPELGDGSASFGALTVAAVVLGAGLLAADSKRRKG